MALAIGGNSVNKAYLGSTEIQKMYLGSELVFSNGLEIPTGIKLTEVYTTDLTPIMTNFRVEEATPTHIHFDAPLGPVTGLTTQGFIVTGKTVTNINTALGYIEIDSPFTFWDNNTIRLDGGNGTVYDFTYEHIVNNISEPSASQPYKYVADNATGSGDGSEGSPWTLAQAAANVVPGSYIAIKAGSYTPNTVEFLTDGEVDNPIKLIGYKTSPNDISGHDWWNPLAPALDASEMPVFDGQNTAARGLRFNGDYYIIKNLSSQNYTTAQFTTSFSPHNKHFENMIAISTTGVNNYGFANESSASEANQRYINISIHSCGNTGIEIKGSRNLVKNCNFYDDPAVNTTMDYHIRANGMDHIIVNNFFRSIAITAQAAHGACLKGSAIATERCLIADNEIVNIKGSVEFRHITVKNNVAKRNEIYADLSGDTGGFLIQNGASANIIEQNTVRNTGEFVRWYSAEEEGGYATQGFDNIFRNNLCYNVGDGIYNGDFGGAAPSNDAQGNLFQNNTFANINNLFGAIKYDFDNTNRFTNNIFDNITNLIGGTATGTQAFVFDYNLFFGGFTAQGTNTITIDPELNASYQPQADFNTIDVPRIDGVWYGKNGNERQDPTTVGGVLSAEEAPNAIPVYSVSTSELGMIEDNESEALNNANKLIAGLNSTVDGINVDGVYFIQTPGTSLTATDIRLASTNSGELKSNQSLSTLFTSYNIKNIECYGVTFSDVFSGGGDYKLFYNAVELVESVNLIKFNNTTFNGNISIYRKDWGRTTDPSTYKIGSFIITNNYINNTRSLPFVLIDVPIDVCTITGNNIHNFDCNLFSMGASNDHSYEDMIYTLRPLFTYTDNTAINDVDWECLGVSGSYLSNCVFEANQVDYLRNYTEGIWTVADRAVYDAYLSCNIVNYKNNTNKNNIVFNALKTDGRNQLIKMKGAADNYVVPIRNVEDNTFITEESWIDECVSRGADKSNAWVFFAQTGVENTNPTSAYIKNNTFDIYSMVGAIDFWVHAVDYEISGNTFNIDYSNGVFTEAVILNDDNVPNNIVFNDNIFNVLNTNQSDNEPAMVKFIDQRTINTDKVSSVIVNNNSGTVINYMFLSNFDTDSFEMTGNTLLSNSEISSFPYFNLNSDSVESSISNNIITYNNGTYLIGSNEYGVPATISENIVFNGIPQGDNGMWLRKGLPSAQTATYRRTYNVDDGQEIYYIEFTLSYDVDHWNITFINTSDVEVTFRMNNNDGTTDGDHTGIKVINSGVSNTTVPIKLRNYDGYSGFNQQFNYIANIKMDITTINTN